MIIYEHLWGLSGCPRAFLPLLRLPVGEAEPGDGVARRDVVHDLGFRAVEGACHGDPATDLAGAALQRVRVEGEQVLQAPALAAGELLQHPAVERLVHPTGAL